MIYIQHQMKTLPWLILLFFCISQAYSQQLPGTAPLAEDGDRSIQMLDGAHRFIERKIDESVAGRAKYWKRDFSSRSAYEQSVEPNRQRFMHYIGVVRDEVDSNVIAIEEKPVTTMEKIAANDDELAVAETQAYLIYQVRWPLFDGVYGEGLLLQPKQNVIANVIAVPDADQTPEQLAGIAPGIVAKSQFARTLAENGFRVLVPMLISRQYVFKGERHQQTYREWIYRQAFHMGRHIIGYEVQKITAAVDWLKHAYPNLRTGVAGYEEGGLLAFYAAAADKRIDAVMVSGYFDNRQKTWDEPLYRNVWGLLTEFGDAEIASLIAPRPLVVEYSAIQTWIDSLETSGPDSVEGFPFNGYKGRLQTPAWASVEKEYNRIKTVVKDGFQQRSLVSNSGQPLDFGSGKALSQFVSDLGYRSAIVSNSSAAADKRKNFDPDTRQVRQLKELENHVQRLARYSDQQRNRYFLYRLMPQFEDHVWNPRSYSPYFSPDSFVTRAKVYREYFANEIIGRFDDKYLPFNARTRKSYDKSRWTGYEVMLDVYPDVIASGILLVPKDIKPGERRPVVVCQHGRNDVPTRVIEGNTTYYNDVAAKLADEGFIVYVPQNPYRGEDRYRWLSRKGQAIKKSLFSFIVAQHEQTLRWLGSLPFVDGSRIAFYGLSYGGETAMRVPAILEGYCLSICSGDFGNWTRKVTDTHSWRSYMFTIEWEMPYFDMGSKFSYAEMAYLIFPRPFMVERGHHDMVQPDEWVASEYGKVRYLYDQFNKGDKTAIEFFNGGHSMKLNETVRFLHKHLHWP
jgi:dienelactone hydrolase